MSQGAIIEVMSSRKLTYLVLLMLAAQLTSFLLGAIVAPNPNSSMQLLATKCVDPKANMESDEWFYPRGEGKCKSIESFSAPEAAEQHLSADHIVFSFQLPLPREGIQLDYRYSTQPKYRQCAVFRFRIRFYFFFFFEFSVVGSNR